MKYVITVIIAIGSLYTAQSQNYKLDLKESELEWIGYGEIGGFKQSGTIDPASGSLTIKDENIESGTMLVNMKSLKSQNENVARHLKNKDFFYVKKYPEASLVLKKVEENVVTADIIIRGISQEVSFPITNQLNGDVITIQGTMIVDRTVHEIKYNSKSFFKGLGNQAIKNEFDLKFDLCFRITN